MSGTRARNRGAEAVSIAILGAGRIGRVHAENIARMDGAVLAAVYDPEASAAAEICRKYRARPSSENEIFADDGIEAVMICAPTELHPALIERAVKAHKHVFCEKPIALEVDRALGCLDVVEREEGFLMIGFNRRFDPHFAELRTRVREGAIGAVELIQITSRDPEPPSSDYLARCGGLFRDMTIHDFDMARFLLGEEVVEVSASVSALIDKGLDDGGYADTAVATLKTAEGKLCVITNSRRATYGYDQRIEAHGSLGMIEAGNPRATTVRYSRAGGTTSATLADFFVKRYAKAYRREAESFVQAVRANDAPWPDGQDGLRALQLAVAAEQSVERGRVVAVRSNSV